MAELNSYQNQAQELASKLWEIANDLRGNMDASKFKNYILGTIFYRYLSERTEKYMDKLLENDQISYEQAYAEPDYCPVVQTWSLKHLGYIIEPQYLFRTLVQKIQFPLSAEDKFSIDDYENAIKSLTDSTIGQKSENAFSGLFNDLRLQDQDLGDLVSERTSLISKVITKINELEFDLTDSKLDILGTAYMHLIGLFASDAGKKGGEFFTPTGPAKLVATLATIGLSEAKSVGDCTCGSASLLLEVQKHLSSHKVGHYYGQENNASTYNLARMNMLMHGVNYNDFNIYKGDTLNKDLYGDLKLTVQVCNPPYSLKYEKKPEMADDQRFRDFGNLPPQKYADMLFLEHMIHHMDEHDGRIAVLLSLGVLSRGNAEASIRKRIIQKLNCLDAVILLAKNLFHNTPIEVCLLILKANRGNNSNNIIFIDASQEFIKADNKNSLKQEHIDKIVDAYVKRIDIDNFAHVASMEEIAANNWNLNIPLYVNLPKDKSLIDLNSIRSELHTIAQAKQDAIAEVESRLSQLGL